MQATSSNIPRENLQEIQIIFVRIIKLQLLRYQNLKIGCKTNQTEFAKAIFALK
jgi:hypothetical protein